MSCLPRLVSLALSCVAAVGGVARGQGCPPTVQLTGAPELVDEISRELGLRGISVAPDAHCPPLRATVTRRGAQLVIAILGGEAAAPEAERVVSDVATAATVIESFARSDVATPLLAARAVSRASAAPPSAPSAPSAPGPAPHHRVHVAASFESALGGDDTTWIGAKLQLSVGAGPIEVAALLRFNQVVDGFDAADVERDLLEVLVGVDVPIALGRTVQVVPGFAGGLGGMETRLQGMKRETGAFRGEAHAALIVPIGRELAVELAAGASVGVQNDFDRSGVMAPPEPLVLLRAGIGLRYGVR